MARALLHHHRGIQALLTNRFSNSSKTPSAHFIAMPAEEAEPDLEVWSSEWDTLHVQRQ